MKLGEVLQLALGTSFAFRSIQSTTKGATTKEGESQSGMSLDGSLARAIYSRSGGAQLLCDVGLWLGPIGVGKRRQYGLEREHNMR